MEFESLQACINARQNTNVLDKMQTFIQSHKSARLRGLERSQWNPEKLSTRPEPCDCKAGWVPAGLTWRGWLSSSGIPSQPRSSKGERVSKWGLWILDLAAFPISLLFPSLTCYSITHYSNYLPHCLNELPFISKDYFYEPTIHLIAFQSLFPFGIFLFRCYPAFLYILLCPSP